MIDTLRLSESSTISTGYVTKLTENASPKPCRKRLRFAPNDTVHHVQSIPSMLQSEEEFAQVYMTPMDWKRSRRDLKKALAQHCPSVEKHQPSVQGKRKTIVQLSRCVVFQEMYSFLEQSLDSDCSFDDCEQQIAASYSAVAEKAGFAAHHVALRVEAEVKSFKKMHKRSRYIAF